MAYLLLEWEKEPKISGIRVANETILRFIQAFEPVGCQTITTSCSWCWLLLWRTSPSRWSKALCCHMSDWSETNGEAVIPKESEDTRGGTCACGHEVTPAEPRER